MSDGYTLTLDVSHKVKSASHATAFHRHIGRDADIEAGIDRRYSNANIDTSRSHLNETFVNDYEGGFKPCESPDEMTNYMHYRHKKFLKKRPRDNAVLLRPVVMQMDKAWFDEHCPNWQTEGLNDQAREYMHEMVGFMSGKLGQKNIPGYSFHLDESAPGVQLSFTPVTEDGRLTQKGFDMFANPTELRKIHQEFRDHMREHGYEARKEVSFRSREHLNTGDFQREADKIRAEGEAVDELKRVNVNLREKLTEERAEIEVIKADATERETQASAAILAAQQREAEAEAEAQAARDALQRARKVFEAAQKHEATMRAIRNDLETFASDLDARELDVRIDEAFLNWRPGGGPSIREHRDIFREKSRTVPQSGKTLRDRARNIVRDALATPDEPTTSHEDGPSF